jgi:hypothetical protein
VQEESWAEAKEVEEGQRGVEKLDDMIVGGELGPVQYSITY